MQQQNYSDMISLNCFFIQENSKTCSVSSRNHNHHYTNKTVDDENEMNTPIYDTISSLKLNTAKLVLQRKAKAQG